MLDIKLVFELKHWLPSWFFLCLIVAASCLYSYSASLAMRPEDYFLLCGLSSIVCDMLLLASLRRCMKIED